MQRTSSKGFTLLEVIASISIFVAAVSLALGGYLFLMKNARSADVQNELDTDAQFAIELLKRDIRLSSMDKMVYHPANPPYTAISFPRAYTNDLGIVERDASGKIIWDETIIYHIRPGTPDELVRMVINPRDETLDETARQRQLRNVVAQNSFANSENATSKVLFSNLVNWQLNPRVGEFYGYSPTEIDESINLGYHFLAPGPHEFTFTVTSKDPASVGYKIGIDTLTVSPSQSPREAEAQLPPTDQSSDLLASAYHSSLSGRHQLLFSADSPNDFFTLTLNNDRWEETNFDPRIFSLHERTIVEFDRDLSPPDNVVQLEGNQTAWEAIVQSGCAPAAPTNLIFNGTAVRTLIKGSGLSPYIESRGEYAKLTFSASPTHSLRIANVHIGESISPTSTEMAYNPSEDLEPVEFRRPDGSKGNSIGIPAGSRKTSEWVPFPIDKDKNYIVTYTIMNPASGAIMVPLAWQPGASGTFGEGLPFSSQFARPKAISLANLAAMESNWNTLSTNTAAVSTPLAIYGLSSIDVSYAKDGIYTSGIFDTKDGNPAYDRLSWNADLPFDTRLAFKVRSGDNPGLSDASPFENISEDTVNLSSSSMSISDQSGRYIQFQALLEADDAALYTPKLKDVSMNWPGGTNMVNISGTFTKGPDKGNFSLRVDGKELQSALIVDLEIYKDIPGMKDQTRRVTSKVKVALSPRNTSM
jgi:prepilin-type N-terminal cleavage/methylation domain-containing protein